MGRISSNHPYETCSYGVASDQRYWTDCKQHTHKVEDHFHLERYRLYLVDPRRHRCITGK